MKITFLLLAHQNPAIAQRLVNILITAGHTVVIHYDKNGSDADFRQLAEAFAHSEQVRVATRVHVAWGHWSIVAAALSGIKAIEESGWEPDYVYLISGSDYPIRPAAELEAFLERHRDKDFIEGVPANTMIWVKGGPQKERYLYRHYVSWRDRRRLAQSMMRIQRFLRMERDFVAGLEPFIGSQWWCLRWQTLRKIMEIGRRPDVLRFFERTLIPDELYFQTLVYNQVPRHEIVERSPTLYQFTDYMVPVVFCGDKAEYLLRQPFFFARKMSPNRSELFDALDECWQGKRAAAPVDDSEIGKFTPEYETARLAARDGRPGIHVIGKPPTTWAENLAWVRKPFFGILGTSATELSIARRLLSGQDDDILCYGEIFGRELVQFAEGQEPFALEMRDVSAPNFLADLVRGARDRQMGFLLQAGHGWHVPDLLFEHPTAKVLLIHGDPLVGLIDSFSTDEEHHMLHTMPPSLLLNRIDAYLAKTAEHRRRHDLLMSAAVKKGLPPTWSWLTEVDLDTSAPARLPRRQRAKLPAAFSDDPWVSTTLERWRDWLARAESCLGIEGARSDEDPIWETLAGELEETQRERRLLIDLLGAAGRDFERSAPDTKALGRSVRLA